MLRTLSLSLVTLLALVSAAAACGGPMSTTMTPIPADQTAEISTPPVKGS